MFDRRKADGLSKSGATLGTSMDARAVPADNVYCSPDGPRRETKQTLARDQAEDEKTTRPGCRARRPAAGVAESVPTKEAVSMGTTPRTLWSWRTVVSLAVMARIVAFGRYLAMTLAAASLPRAWACPDGIASTDPERREPDSVQVSERSADPVSFLRRGGLVDCCSSVQSSALAMFCLCYGETSREGAQCLRDPLRPPPRARTVGAHHAVGHLMDQRIDSLNGAVIQTAKQPKLSTGEMYRSQRNHQTSMLGEREVKRAAFAWKARHAELVTLGKSAAAQGHTPGRTTGKVSSAQTKCINRAEAVRGADPEPARLPGLNQWDHDVAQTALSEGRHLHRPLPPPARVRMIEEAASAPAQRHPDTALKHQAKQRQGGASPDSALQSSPQNVVVQGSEGVRDVELGDPPQSRDFRQPTAGAWWPVTRRSPICTCRHDMSGPQKGGGIHERMTAASLWPTLTRPTGRSSGAFLRPGSFGADDCPTKCRPPLFSNAQATPVGQGSKSSVPPGGTGGE